MTLEYVPPDGAGTKAVKKFFLNAVVNAAEPKVACDKSGSGVTTVASNDDARVLRSARVAYVGSSAHFFR